MGQPVWIRKVAKPRRFYNSIINERREKVEVGLKGIFKKTVLSFNVVKSFVSVFCNRMSLSAIPIVSEFIV